MTKNHYYSSQYGKTFLNQIVQKKLFYDALFQIYLVPRFALSDFFLDFWERRMNFVLVSSLDCSLIFYLYWGFKCSREKILWSGWCEFIINKYLIIEIEIIEIPNYCRNTLCWHIVQHSECVAYEFLTSRIKKLNILSCRVD